jgi:hypothetical protein
MRMEIAASSLSFTSNHTKTQAYRQTESLLVSAPASGGAQGQPAPGSPESGKTPAGTDPVTLSKGARRSRQTHESQAADACRQTLMQDLNIRILKDLVERITGKRIDMQDISRAFSGEQQPVEVPRPDDADAAPGSAGWGVDYRYESFYSETEATTFAAEGEVRTADGRTIDISVSLSMSRQFVEQEQIHLQAGDPVVKDPLVLNFDGTAAELSQTRFAFDIDCDGAGDQISTLSPGSGYLAVDKNGDGTINNGSELFGPATGHGFSELAAHDEDGNHWIDENDSIYDKLRIWTRTPAGDSQLFALGEKGVGAICLDYLASPFDLTDSSNRLLGQVRETGLYLTEAGAPGTIQELDIVV